MRSLLLASTATLALCATASAQVNRFVGPPPNATHLLDFDSPFVPSGPIGSTDPAFTAAGIVSVVQVGTFFPGGDVINAGSNGSGQSLVSQSGAMAVAGINQALDNLSAGAGWEITLAQPATQFGALFVDQINMSYQVELFLGTNSLGVGSWVYGGGGGSFPEPPDYWSGPGPFDRIVITAPNGAGGFGIDDFAFNEVTVAPTAYCTAGTSTNGCVPSIGANANPSVTMASACLVQATGVEGQKSGILFYGIDNSGFAPLPWGVGGTSLLCVKPPTQRSASQSSGGTTGLCDGALSLDWNAFQAANPAALGNPWMAGEKVYVQGWYRDPPAVKTTNLTDGLELTYLP
jgi:hypothetical protein